MRILKTMQGWVLFILLLAPSALQAQYYGGDPGAYLRSGIGARALGMGNAVTADCPDASAMYWNPGAVPFLESDRACSQAAILGAERSWNYLSYVHPATLANGGRYGYGLGWIGFSAGNNLEARAENRPDPDYTFGDFASAWMLTAATGLAPDMGLGINVKVLTYSLDTDSASGVGGDIGFWHCPDPAVRWGIVVQDIFSRLNWPSDRLREDFPLLIRGGASYHLEPVGLILAAGLGWQYSVDTSATTDIKYQVGAEYALFPTFNLRVGFDSGRPTAGIGWRFLFVHLCWIQLDYALAAEQLPGAGLTQFFSLNLDLIPPAKPTP